MRRGGHCLARDCRGATAAEFALVLPLMLLMIFAVIDAGLLLWEVNRAEKTTQIGARYAIVTDIIPPQLVSYNYVGSTVDGKVLVAGDPIASASALGTLRCTSTACVCTGTCPTNAAIPSLAFTRLVDRMKVQMPRIVPANVVVTFRGSGIGFAGDPNGMDIVPLVTVELTGVTFTPLTSFALASFTLPSFRTTLSAESSAGTLSN